MTVRRSIAEILRKQEDKKEGSGISALQLPLSAASGETSVLSERRRGGSPRLPKEMGQAGFPQAERAHLARQPRELIVRIASRAIKQIAGKLTR